MAINMWGSTTNSLTLLKKGALVSVADSGGTELAVATYNDGGPITIDFYDEQGLVSGLRAPISITPSGVVQNLSVSASGVLGYVASWTVGTTLFVNYIGPTAPETKIWQIDNVDTTSAVEVAGYQQLALNGARWNLKTNATYTAADGFEVVYRDVVDGMVKLAAYAYDLDAKKDLVGESHQSALLEIGLGKDPSISVGHNGEHIVSYIGSDGFAHLSIVAADFVTSQTGIGPIIGGDRILNATQVTKVETAWLNDGNAMVAWLDAAGIHFDLITLTPSANATDRPGTNTGVGVSAAPDFLMAGIDNFTLSTLLDDPNLGFTLTFHVSSATEHTVYAQTYSITGALLDRTPLTVATDVTSKEIVSASLIGDRGYSIVQSNDGTFTGAALDARTPGQTLTGDVGGGVAPDVLVGTTGNDIINGLEGADILDGAMGDDRIFAGSGDDAIDGGGGDGTISPAGKSDPGIDTVVFANTFDQYGIRALGHGRLFIVTDKTAGATNDGTDTIRNVEFFEFKAGPGVAAGDPPVTLAPGIDGVVVVRENGEIALRVDTAQLAGLNKVTTPSAWGLVDAQDGNDTPELTRTVDVDGFLVNDGANRAGFQSNPVVSDSVGEFVSVMWTDLSSGMPRIKAAFMDVLGRPDRLTPLPDVVNVTDGLGNESNAVVTSGGANSGWGFVFNESNIVDGEVVSSYLKTNFFGLSTTGTETWVDDVAANSSTPKFQHSASMFGSFLDRKTIANDLGVPVAIEGPSLTGAAKGLLLQGASDGYTVAYIESDAPGAPGVLKLQRFEVPLDALGTPQAPKAAGRDGLAGVSLNHDGLSGTFTTAEDHPFEIPGITGLVRSPSVTALHTFETVVTFIEQVGTTEIVKVQAIDDAGNFIYGEPQPLSGTDVLAAGSVALVASTGAVNAAVVWVADMGDHLEVHSRMLSSAGTGINGNGFGFGTSDMFSVIDDLKPHVLGGTIDLASMRITGMSGEDSNDFIVQWVEHAAGGSAVYAQHISVFLDPVTGIAIGMSANGPSIMVSESGAGLHDQASVAGLLGDRFISVWHDDGTLISADGGNIVAKIIDTRDAAGEEIVGDFVTPTGAIRARRDVLVGTIGNDTINGDISDSDGAVDQIFGGMGDDVMQGGPGLKGAAGIAEIIDGGIGTDTSVYTGNLADYSITAIFDPIYGAGYEIVDNRPTADAAGNPLQHDGVDNVFNVELLKFADKTINVATQLYNPPPPAPESNPTDAPVHWSLDDPTFAAVQIVDPGNRAATQTQVAVTNLQDDAAMAYVEGGNSVWGVRYDITGKPDPLWVTPAQAAAGPIRMDQGLPDVVSVTNPTVAMAGGLGFVAVWQAAKNDASTEVHLRFGSTATNTPFDTTVGPIGYGFAGGEVVVSSAGAPVKVLAGSPLAVQGYEIVNSLNDTLEVGFHVAFVDASGNLKLARYEIPVYDVDANGGLLTPSLPSAAGAGAETTPVLIGKDGLRDFSGTNPSDDTQADAIPTVASTADGPISKITLATLHDGQLVLTYQQGTSVHVKVFDTSVQESANRGSGSIAVEGLTTFDYASSMLATEVLANVNAGQAQVVAQQNGSFGVFWAENSGPGSNTLHGTIFKGAAPSWEQINVAAYALPDATNIKIVGGGVNADGLENGFVVLYTRDSHIFARTIFMDGHIGTGEVQVDVSNGGNDHSIAYSASAIDNGLIVVGYYDASNAGDVLVTYLDTRTPGDVFIGPRAGAPADVAVGTIGSDYMDGRNRPDIFFGGLGNDVITLGGDNDFGDGGKGNDTILGGVGQDQLLGGEGDDLLLGNGGGDPDPKVDAAVQSVLDSTTGTGRALAAGLNISLANLDLLRATDAGVDLISGGAGSDTISYRGEFSPGFRIDLKNGIVLQKATTGVDVIDNGVAATYVLEDVIGTIDANGAFAFSRDIENAEGSTGNDIIIGTDAVVGVSNGVNVLTGGGGRDYIDGGTGADTAVFAKTAANYWISRATVNGLVTITEIVSINAGVPVLNLAEQTTIRSVEFLQFADTRVAIGTSTGVFGLQASAVSTVPVIANGPVLSTDVPVAANDDVFLKINGTAANVNLFANDLAPVGQTLSLVSFTYNGTTVQVVNGTATRNFGDLEVKYANSVFTFTDKAGLAANYDVSYTVQTSSGQASAVAHVHVSQGTPTTGGLTISNATLNNAGTSVALTAASTLRDFDVNGLNLINSLTYKWYSSIDLAGTTKTQISLNSSTSQSVSLGASLQYVFVEASFTDPVDGLQTVRSSNAVVLGGTGADAISTSGVSHVFSGAGNDTITLDAGTPATVVINGGADTDIVKLSDASSSFKPVSNVALVNVEAVSAAGLTVGATIDLSLQTEGFTITGGTLGDNLLGGSAADVIDGGTGADTMTGGGGNDVYTLDHIGDIVIEQAGAGTDRIKTSLSSINMSSAQFANIEEVELTGNTAGQTVIVGAGVNRIVGTVAAKEVVSYAAATAAMQINLSTQLITGAAAFVDVISGIDGAIGSNFNDSLTGNTGDNFLSGGGGNDSITANEGNDTLNGGAGDDVMNGGAGNDYYVVDSSKDTITDASGVDTVESSINFTLGNTLENLVLTGSASNGTGNGVANVITDNASVATRLDGAGGDDTFKMTADNNADQITGGAGTDTADYSTIANAMTVLFNANTTKSTTITIAGATADTMTGVENFTAGSGNDSIVGDGLINVLNGGAGADTIDGGAGNDVLDGGLGAVGDYFRFSSTANGTDTIKGFASVDGDKILLARTSFTGLDLGGGPNGSPDGKLDTIVGRVLFLEVDQAANTTVNGTGALAQLIYNKQTGDLYYDSNGQSAGATKIAVIDGHPVLAADDFRFF